MKITLSELKQIIRQEVKRSRRLNESEDFDVRFLHYSFDHGGWGHFLYKDTDGKDGFVLKHADPKINEINELKAEIYELRAMRKMKRERVYEIEDPKNKAKYRNANRLKLEFITEKDSLEKEIEELTEEKILPKIKEFEKMVDDLETEVNLKKGKNGYLDLQEIKEDYTEYAETNESYLIDENLPSSQTIYLASQLKKR